MNTLDTSKAIQTSLNAWDDIGTHLIVDGQLGPNTQHALTRVITY